jgi:hypothetical protein
MIDYWYLGTACIGLFLFAVAYSGQRDIVLTKISTGMYELTEIPVRKLAVLKMGKLSQFLCGNEILAESSKPCEGLKDVLNDVKPLLSVDQVSALNKKFKDEVSVPYGAVFPPQRLKDNPNFSSPSLATAQGGLDDSVEFVKAAPSQLAARRNELTEVALGIGQLVIWPFILAYALALRITKVTTDVFEWAK